MEQRPIDKMRDSGGAMNVGTLEDGAILRMETINKRLFVIKERSIYEMISADAIDPGRTNINLPRFTHKLIANKGTESEIVSKTFLTAQTLFRSQFFDAVDTDKAVMLTLDLLQELSALDREISDYFRKEKEVEAQYAQIKESRASHAIPAIPDIETRCKTIVQKANHVEQCLIEIILVFYPDSMTKNAHFSTFHEYLVTAYGKDDLFVLFIEQAVFFMKVMRLLRNGLDHRLTTVTIVDYELQVDSNILSPTIELKHKDGQFPRMPLSHFLSDIVPNMLFIIENTFAYMADKRAKSDGFAYEVREIPEADRLNKFVKFAFWSGIMPGGFYHQ